MENSKELSASGKKTRNKRSKMGRESRTPDRSMYNDTTSILSSLPGVSVHKVRQNRQKIELDVLKLHNRI